MCNVIGDVKGWRLCNIGGRVIVTNGTGQEWSWMSLRLAPLDCKDWPDGLTQKIWEDLNSQFSEWVESEFGDDDSDWDEEGGDEYL